MVKLTGRQQKAALALASACGAVMYLDVDVVGTLTGAPRFGRSALAGSSSGGVRRSLSGISYDRSSSRTLPSFYDDAANVWEQPIAQEQPFFWYIPKAGGAALSKIFTFCLDFVSCSPMAIETPTDHLVINSHSDGGRYLNVDPSTDAGLAKAAEWNVVSGEFADVLITQKLQEAAPLFTQSNRARLFTFLRQPVKRITDLFYYKQRATWEPTFDPDLAKMTLKEYAQSDKLVTNFVTRTLLGHPTEELTPDDVDLAKDILRRKFVVGIMEVGVMYEKSVVRFEQYFGWWDDYSVLTNSTVNYCHYKKIEDSQNLGSTSKPNSEEEAKAMIAARNWADMELFLYAKHVLFPAQAVLVA